MPKRVASKVLFEDFIIVSEGVFPVLRNIVIEYLHFIWIGMGVDFRHSLEGKTLPSPYFIENTLLRLLPG